MRNLSCTLVVGAVVVLFGATGARASTLNFASVPGATITFYGDTDSFVFLPEGGGHDFQLTSVVGAADPDTVGLVGRLEGTFQVGAIAHPFPGVEVAPVTGPGTLTIVDEAALPFTADVGWVSITTVGTGGILNLAGVANLTGLTYAGANADLRHLAAAGSGASAVTFQFVPPRSLATLLRNGTRHSTSFSGTIVPEPGTILLLGTGLICVAALQRRSGRKGELPAGRES